MISPPEARHEMVLASISVRDIKPPLLWQLIFPEIDSNKISPPIVEPETEPLKFFKFIFGEMHSILFSSQKVSPKKIQNSGYNFKHSNFDNAIVNLDK